MIVNNISTYKLLNNSGADSQQQPERPIQNNPPKHDDGGDQGSNYIDPNMIYNYLFNG